MAYFWCLHISQELQGLFSKPSWKFAVKVSSASNATREWQGRVPGFFFSFFVQGICDTSTSVIMSIIDTYYYILYKIILHHTSLWLCVILSVCLSQPSVDRPFPRTRASSCLQTTLWVTRTTTSAFITSKCSEGKGSTLRQAASVWLKVTS